MQNQHILPYEVCIGPATTTAYAEGRTGGAGAVNRNWFYAGGSAFEARERTTTVPTTVLLGHNTLL